MKVAFSFFVASLFALSAHGWIRGEYSPATDPILKRLKYVCMANEFNVGPMKANEVKYVNGNVCARVSCSENAFIEYAGCYVSIASANCKIESGPADRNYPQCCQVTVC